MILVVFVIVVVFGGVYLFKNKNAAPQPQEEINKNSAGLQITDQIAGTGAEAKAGNLVTVNYIGTLTNGTRFDSSYDRNQPFSFTLGAGEVIKGWDEGVLGMKVGGKRKLVIPPSLAYGNQEVGGGLIPANSTLIFEIELLEVKTQ